MATVEFSLSLNLLPGIFHLGIKIASPDLSVWYDRVERAIDFVISGGNGAYGIADLNASFQVANIVPISGSSVHPETLESAIDD